MKHKIINRIADSPFAAISAERTGFRRRLFPCKSNQSHLFNCGFKIGSVTQKARPIQNFRVPPVHFSYRWFSCRYDGHTDHDNEGGMFVLLGSLILLLPIRCDRFVSLVTSARPRRTRTEEIAHMSLHQLLSAIILVGWCSSEAPLS